MSDPKAKGLIGQAQDQGQALENLSKSYTNSIDQLMRPTYFHANTVDTEGMIGVSPNYEFLSTVSPGGTATWDPTVQAVVSVNVPPSCELLIEAQGTWILTPVSGTPGTDGEYVQTSLISVADSTYSFLRSVYNKIHHDYPSGIATLTSFYMTARVTPPANTVYRVGLSAIKTANNFTSILKAGYSISIAPRYVRAGTDNRK